MALYQAEIRNWPKTIELYGTDPKVIAELWAGLSPEERADKGLLLQFFIAYVRISDVPKAREIGSSLIEEANRIPISENLGARLVRAMSWAHRYGVEWALKPMLAVIRWRTRDLATESLFAAVYLSMFANQRGSLRFLLALQARERDLDRQTRSRIDWFFGFLLAMNGFADIGRQYVKRGITRWAEFPDAPNQKLWAFESSTVHAATAYFAGDLEGALAIQIETNETYPDPTFFPFAQVYHHSTLLRTALATDRLAEFEASLKILRSLLGNVYDLRFALRAHSFGAVFLHLQGNREEAFKSLGIADSFAEKTVSQSSFELSYHLMQKSKIYLLEGLVERAIHYAQLAVDGFGRETGVGSPALEAHFQLLASLSVAQAILPMGKGKIREHRRLARASLAETYRLTRFATRQRERVRTFARMFQDASGLEANALLAQVRANTVLSVVEREILARGLGAPETMIRQGQAHDRTLVTISKNLERTRRLTGFLSRLDTIGHADDAVERVLACASELLRELLESDEVTVSEVAKDSSSWVAQSVELSDGIFQRDEHAVEGVVVCMIVSAEGRRHALTARSPLGRVDFRRDILETMILMRKIVQSKLDERTRSRESARLTRLAAIEEVAAQVAHDIRSPLAALQLISHDAIDEVPEELRNILRLAVARVKDIANQLSSRDSSRVHQVSLLPETESTANLPSLQQLGNLIDMIISEKRVQYRSRLDVEIGFIADESSYGLFSRVSPVEFMRVISNLVNNSVEAIEGAGQVTLEVGNSGSRIEIRVRDNGKGIPAEILPKLTQRGQTHGKIGGTGLGLHHARRSLENWGGTLDIHSEPGRGTLITLSLPTCEAPRWFVPELAISAGDTIVVLDDDASIHRVWDERFSATKGVRMLHFSTSDALEAWVLSPEGRSTTSVVYLLDYDLKASVESGLDLIEKLGIAKSAVLVTSHHETASVVTRCETAGVRLLPKGMAGFVPVRARERMRA